MLYNILTTFAPWIFYFVLRSYFALPIAIAASLTIIMLFICFWKNLFIRKYFLSWISLLIFGMIGLNAAFLHNHFFETYTSAVSYFAFALTGLLSLVLKKPFTIQYAKNSVSKEKWEHPVFIRINFILTTFWSGLFLINFILNCLPHWQEKQEIYRLISYFLTTIGIIFTIEYPKWYRERYRHENKIKEGDMA